MTDGAAGADTLSPLAAGATRLKRSTSVVSQGSTRQAPAPEVGAYKLGRMLGRGATGRVWIALDQSTGEVVAVKQVPVADDSQKEIKREMEMLKELHHENIVSYKDYIHGDDKLSLVLEYAENGSLYSMIQAFGVFPERLAVVYIQQVLRGLEYLHDRDVAHRDIKASNTLVFKDGVVKLADFGLAKSGQNRTSVVGTPYWMAPEVIKGADGGTDGKGLGVQSDIWSLGSLVIELLCGSPPYFQLNTMSALYRIVEDAHPPLPEDISDDLEDFLLRCFIKDPDARPSAAELLKHPWLRDDDEVSASAEEPPLSPTRDRGATVGYEAAAATIREFNQTRKGRLTDIDWSSKDEAPASAAQLEIERLRGQLERAAMQKQLMERKISQFEVAASASAAVGGGTERITELNRTLQLVSRELFKLYSQDHEGSLDHVQLSDLLGDDYETAFVSLTQTVPQFLGMAPSDRPQSPLRRKNPRGRSMTPPTRPASTSSDRHMEPVADPAQGEPEGRARSRTTGSPLAETPTGSGKQKKTLAARLFKKGGSKRDSPAAP